MAIETLYTGPTAAELAHIPDDLKTLPQWVLFQLTEEASAKTGELKLVKRPMNSTTLDLAATDNPDTWHAYTHALTALPCARAAWEQHPPPGYCGAGLGFVLTTQDEYLLVDMDHAVDERGVILPWAHDIITTLNSYSQYSVSRRGLHTLIKGHLPPGGQQHGNFQTWETLRFVAMTGRHLPGTPATIEARQSQFTMVHAAYILKPKADAKAAKQQTKRDQRQTVSGLPRLSDDEILTKARAAKNNAKFNRLWAGDWSGYVSQSEGDEALCFELAFWTRDADQLDSLFRQSGLYREDKWGDRDDYRESTITKALDLVTTWYDQDAYTATLPGHSTNGHAAHAPPTGLALKPTKTGAPRPVIFNILAVLTYDPRWDGVFGYDEFANVATLRKCPPYLDSPDTWQIRPLEDHDDTETSNWLQREYDLCASTTLVAEGIQTFARRHPYHPIRDYLAGVQWDTTPRLDAWLTTYCHADDTAYTRAVGAKTLISAVAHVQEPGSKVDTMPILEADQGALKSTVWRILASDAWFSDTLPDLHDKDAAQALRGKWVIEMGELASLQRSEVEHIKRFISANQDHYRPSYGRRAATFPRQNIFVGSTNKDTYLKDETGNRRFWPVRLTGACDVEALQRDRDQLWAEAYARYQQGEAWHLTPMLETVAAQEQAERVESDPWDDSIAQYVARLTWVTSAEIFSKCLGLELAHLTQAHTKRIGAILRRLKWQGNKPIWVDAPDGSKKQIKAWKPSLADCPPVVVPAAVTGVTSPSTESQETGNTVSPSKINCVTAVTGVTDKNKHSEEHMTEPVTIRSYDSIEVPVTSGNTGNSGNSGLPCPRCGIPGMSLLNFGAYVACLGCSTLPEDAVAQLQAEAHRPCANPQCGGTQRWLDKEVWRCIACWPPDTKDG